MNTDTVAPRVQSEGNTNLKPARAGRIVVGLLLALGFLNICGEMLPMIARDDLFSGDAAQHTWWTYRFADASLFPNDRAYDYYSLPAFSPFGYQFYMRMLVPYFDAQRLAESTGMVLAMMSLLLTWRIGFAIGGRAGAAAAIAGFIAMNVAHMQAGGFPRSFAMTLFLAGILAVVRRRWPMVGVVLILIALLYPPLVFNLVPVVGLVLFVGIARTRRLPRGFFTMGVLAGIAVVIIAAIYLRPLPDWVGRWFTWTEARHMPEWSRLGRTAFFRPWQSYYFTSSTSGIGMTFRTAWIGLLVLIGTMIALRRAISAEAWFVLGVGVGMYLLAQATLFRLYLPSRYLSYALPAFAILALAGAGRELRQKLRHWINRPHYENRKIVATLCGIAIFVWAWLLTSRAIATYQGSPMWDVPNGYDASLRFIESLPPQTRLAAHPDDANGIPLRARRSVLANTETSVAFNTVFYAWAKERLEASFDMLYAPDWQTLDATADRYDVSVFLLERRRLQEPAARRYFAPFEEENQQRIAHAANGFALLNPPADRVLFQDGDIVLIRVGTHRP